MGIPVLGICYGVQLMASSPRRLRRILRSAANMVAGTLNVLEDESTLRGIAPQSAGLEQPWRQDHPDPGRILRQSRTTENSAYAAIQHRENSLFGLQFHPEVAHTPLGKDILENFLYRACGCSPDWTMGSFIEQTCREIRRKVHDDKVVLGLSGGVDSSVAAALIHRAIGDQANLYFR